MSENKTIEFSCGYIQLMPEGFFYVRMKNGSNSTIASVKESQDLITKIQPEGNIFIMAFAGIGSTSDDDIYDFISNGDFAKRVKAQAIIVNDLATRLMGNLFIRYIKKQRNIKMFSKQADAEAWLKKEMQKV